MPSWARSFPPLAFLLGCFEMFISYFADGLYPAKNIEAALKRAFGTSRSILDFSDATSTGTRVGLTVATTSEKPSCRIFTNYNGAGERGKDQGKCKVYFCKLSMTNSLLRSRDKAKGRIRRSTALGNVSSLFQKLGWLDQIANASKCSSRFSRPGVGKMLLLDRRVCLTFSS